MSDSAPQPNGSQFSLAGVLSWMFTLSLCAAALFQRSTMAAVLLFGMFVAAAGVLLVGRLR